MNPFRFASLKARLTALTLSLVGTVWLAAAVFTWFEARHEAEEIFDAHLVQAASLLVAQAARETDDGDAADDGHVPSLHRYARQVVFQVWVQGALQLHSPHAPATPLSDAEGFSDRTIDGEGWRVFSARNPRQATRVQVGERHSARSALAREIAAGLMRPMLVALPLLALLIWFAVHRGIAPLAATASEIERRSPERLAPLSTAGLPAEALPLVERLNALFARVARSIDQERRFTADAAHELRTPLAGLRAQAQVAAAADDAARTRALAAVMDASDRMTHLIEQLLVLARVDAGGSDAFAPVDLVRIAEDTLADAATRALAARVDIELAAPDTLKIQGNAAWLAILLRNLVDNAVRHSPAAGQVRVALTDTADKATIEVCDQGPGVPDDELSRLGERFHRVLTADGDSAGSGLGLSIVRRIAELHGGTVTFANREDASGLRATITLGRPDGPAARQERVTIHS